MGNLFGVRRRAPIVTAQDKAILQLKQQRDKIKIYQKRTEADLIKSKELALSLFQNGMKDRALIVLRRKKNMEEILCRTDKQLETLEQMVSDIEYTQIEVSVVEGLKVGTEALKQLTSLMNIDDIQQMMEDNEEAAEKQKEITNILQHSSERYDEDELLKELAALQGKPAEKEEEKEAPKVVVVEEQNDLPEVPTSKVYDIQPEEHEVVSEIEDLPTVPNDEPTKNEPPKSKSRQMEQAQ